MVIYKKRKLYSKLNFSENKNKALPIDSIAHQRKNKKPDS